MADSFFFYDLETTGISPARDRIMQFAGQRTDLDLKPIGEPVNVRLKLTADILPAPEAILLTGLSPLNKEGLNEAQFSQLFNEDVVRPGTIFSGFNNVRFDDEFIRYLNYRNFYDAYSWHWKDGSSRWDLLDVIRMTRALRPAGINWPFNDMGKPSNTLVLMSSANKLEHMNAHDALSDSLATIEVARLLKEKQPKLFDYLLSLRSKQSLIKLIESNDSLLYTSSHYSSDFLHTSVVLVISLDKEAGSALVYDLRENPENFLQLSAEELAALWRYDPDSPRARLPVKTVRLNRCPALAPLSVLDAESIKRLKLNMTDIDINRRKFPKDRTEFGRKIKKAAALLDKERDRARKGRPHVPIADEQLYDGFIPKADSALFPKARELAQESRDFALNFDDKRLNKLYSLYRARNYPQNLSKDESLNWQQFVKDKLFSGQPNAYAIYSDQLAGLKEVYKSAPEKLRLLDDLKRYGLNILNDYGTD